MDWLTFIARLILCATLMVSGIGKLFDPEAAPSVVSTLHLPHWVTAPIRWVLPVVELSVALLLLPGATAHAASIAALTLLLLFTAFLLKALASGREVDCHCFGKLHTKPVSPRDLSRNTGLIATAVVVAIWDKPGHTISAFDFLENASATDVGLLVLSIVTVGSVGLLAFLFIQLLKQNGRILARISALEERLNSNVPDSDRSPGRLPSTREPTLIGEPLPEVDVQQPTGELIALPALVSRTMPTLLVFTNALCAACDSLYDDLASWERRYGDRFLTIVINRGRADSASQIISKKGVTRVLADQVGAVASFFGVAVTPSALMITESGRVGTAVSMGPQAISELVTEQLSLALPQTRRENDGEPYPAEVMRANGRVLLFWDPNCGFCQSMLPAFKQWEASQESRSLNVIIVFKGDEYEARDLAVSSPIMPDEVGTKMAIYGIQGTPMAVAVDRHGLAVSPIAVGSDEIFHLLTTRNHDATTALS